jgi:hypothetical protein
MYTCHEDVKCLSCLDYIQEGYFAVPLRLVQCYRKKVGHDDTALLPACACIPFNVVKKTAAQIVLEAVPNAEKTLLSGFTSVRDVGVYRALTDMALRDAIAVETSLDLACTWQGRTSRSQGAQAR